ncbi:MAG: OmcA/MtrC family decaheme c-type cytochrome [Acidobacteria bacterium]|nr:OmcA/MtrC family decaheme c-type cytochrome [Acidobacteriota bacterium]
MNGRRLFCAFAGLLLLGAGLTIAGDGITPIYKPSDKAYYLTEAQASFVRPGLKIDLQKVEFEPPNVIATFRIIDDQGQPLDRLGIETPGAVALSFYIARIKPGDTQYTNYRTTIQSSPITGNSTTVAAADANGTYTSLGNGTYKYTFGTKLPANFEVNATHTVAISAERDLSEFGLKDFIDNALLTFVPNGSAVTQVREIVSTGACNQCHDPLGAHHSGSRQQVGLCILCHQPQTTDADTGNTVDFKVMIHKIHRGADLPSVKAGTPYRIIRVSGGTQYVYDWSTLHWPQDVRNCTTCHQGASQADKYKTNPSRVACGSCHDDVDFATGTNHPGGVQVDDSKCSICHPADTGLEFDLSVAGAHTITESSKQLAGLKYEILEVRNTNPGDKPMVTFTVADGKGNPVDPNTLGYMRFSLAGPTSDYRFHVRERVPKAEAGPTGYTYTFNAAIPADASGTFAIALDAWRQVTIPGSLLGQSFTVMEAPRNPVFYFGIGGAKPVPRRQVVDRNKCNECHKNLVAHLAGFRRLDVEFCVMCHNATANDIDGRRPADQYPLEAIQFRHMVHRIHTGHELENDFTIWRGGTPRNYNKKLFPGDRRNCSTCHVGNSYQLPLPEGLANTVMPRFFYTPLTPAASACLGCHDGQATAAHAYLMTAPFGESCAVCHAEGADFAVSKVHAH